MIEVTTTAMPRPEVLEKTYRSFTKNITGVDWTKSICYINIDPLPGKKKEVEETEKVAQKFFGKVVSRKPKAANYTLAYKWLWSQPKKKFFINIEDDWELLEKISLEALLRGFDKSKIAVPLRAYSYLYQTCPTSPSVYRTSFFKNVSDFMKGEENPETQLHEYINQNYKKYADKKHRIVNIYPYGEWRLVVKDIGREWMDKTDYVRPQMLDKKDKRYKKKCHFTQWLVRP